MSETIRLEMQEGLGTAELAYDLADVNTLLITSINITDELAENASLNRKALFEQSVRLAQAKGFTSIRMVTDNADMMRCFWRFGEDALTMSYGWEDKEFNKIPPGAKIEDIETTIKSGRPQAMFDITANLHMPRTSW